MTFHFISLMSTTMEPSLKFCFLWSFSYHHHSLYSCLISHCTLTTDFICIHGDWCLLKLEGHSLWVALVVGWWVATTHRGRQQQWRGGKRQLPTEAGGGGGMVSGDCLQKPEVVLASANLGRGGGMCPSAPPTSHLCSYISHPHVIWSLLWCSLKLLKDFCHFSKPFRWYICPLIRNQKDRGQF